MARRATTSRRANTLPELLISLIITSLLALGVASIMFAAGYGTSSRREVRRLAVRSQLLQARLNDSIRNSQAVLASGSGYVVLWTGDTRVNNQVNLSEIQLIELPAASNTLSSYTVKWPQGWTQAQIDTADVAYAANSNFATVAQNAKSSGNFPATTWSDGVSGFTVTLNNGTPSLATLATWSLTLTDQLLSETVVGAGGLRSQSAPQ